jgi:hypothetical protein
MTDLLALEVVAQDSGAAISPAPNSEFRIDQPRSALNLTCIGMLTSSVASGPLLCNSQTSAVLS